MDKSRWKQLFCFEMGACDMVDGSTTIGKNETDVYSFRKERGGGYDDVHAAGSHHMPRSCMRHPSTYTGHPNTIPLEVDDDLDDQCPSNQGSFKIDRCDFCLNLIQRTPGDRCSHNVPS